MSDAPGLPAGGGLQRELRAVVEAKDAALDAISAALAGKPWLPPVMVTEPAAA